MQILSKEEFQLKREYYKKLIEEGAIFIYPTDNLYAIGCDARNETAVKKIKQIKKTSNPLSIIPPTKDWIIENCLMTEEIQDILKKTNNSDLILLNLVNDIILATNINESDDSIGIRIPNNWFFEEIKTFDFPIIETSANIFEREIMTTIENMDSELNGKIDFIIYDGEKKGHPSKTIDLRMNNI